MGSPAPMVRESSCMEGEIVRPFPCLLVPRLRMTGAGMFGLRPPIRLMDGTCLNFFVSIIFVVSNCFFTKSHIRRGNLRTCWGTSGGETSGHAGAHPEGEPPDTLGTTVPCAAYGRGGNYCFFCVSMSKSACSPAGGEPRCTRGGMIPAAWGAVCHIEMSAEPPSSQGETTASKPVPS